MLETIMKKTATALALGTVLLISGCFPISLHPLYTETNLALSFLSLDWLGKLLEKDPQAIRHERIGTANDQTILLTAPTGELQKFVLKYLEDKDAFLQPINLKRQPPEPKKE